MKYYDDMGPGKGNCTFGIGALVHRGPCSAEELVKTITDTQVEVAFDLRGAQAEQAIERNVHVALTQAQCDALVSLTFNRRPSGSFRAYELINAGNLQGAANWIASLTHVMVRKNGRAVSVVAPGLIQRRIEESAPFRTARYCARFSACCRSSL